MKCVFFVVAVIFTVLEVASTQSITDIIDVSSDVAKTGDTDKTGGTTSEPHSSTPSVPPSTTPSKPTETPPKTTEPPSTISTVSPTPPRTTTEAPQSGPWAVNKSGDVCIVATFGADMKIEYFNQSNSSFIGDIALPSNATVNEQASSCGNITQVFVLDFVHNSSLTLTFKKDGEKVILNELKLQFNEFQQFFPESKTNKIIMDLSNLTQFSATSGHSYLCSKTNIVSDRLSSISFTDIQIEAFRSSSDNKFSLAEDCDSDVSNIVPIAVGCALAGLVVIVLIAYLVGRRHKRQRGYESQGL